MLRQGEFLHPDDFLPLLSEFVETSRGEPKKGPVVIMSGVLPSPPEILSLLDELGVRIGDDDLLSCSRRLLVSPEHQPRILLKPWQTAILPCRPAPPRTSR